MLMRSTDVLIIGTGFGAAAPALRLAQAGLRVTMIEKGPRIDPATDFRQTQDPRYLMRYLHSFSGDNLGLTYAEALGGGSGFYEMVSLRAPSAAFEQVDPSGTRLWPASVNRALLDPWYDRADEMLHVEQIAPDVVPKSGLVFARMMKNLGYSCERARYAVQGCLGSGFCVTGCIYGAKQSLLVTYLPQAVEAGAEIDTDLEAELVQPIASPGGRAGGTIAEVPYRYEVLCRHRTTGEARAYRARIVILAGGTLGTARLLLASRHLLRGLSDQVGRNIAFNGGVKAAGILPEGFAEGDMFTGRSHPGMISYHFLGSHGITISAAKPMPLQLVTAARLRLEGDPRRGAWWGEPHAELMRAMRHRMMVMVALGMTPPLGRLTMRPGGKLELHLPLTGELRRYHHETLELLHGIMRANGCRVVDAELIKGDGQPRDDDVFFSSAHHVGSCRMADARSRGVVDSDGEVFGQPGLYVSDGAAIPSSLAVNTSLTILANAERIAAGIARRYPARAALSLGIGQS